MAYLISNIENKIKISLACNKEEIERCKAMVDEMAGNDELQLIKVNWLVYKLFTHGWHKTAYFIHNNWCQ